MINEENTVDNVRDGLDNYGGHLPVVIESHDGQWFNVGTISTGQFDGGRVAVVIQIDEKVR